MVPISGGWAEITVHREVSLTAFRSSMHLMSQAASTSARLLAAMAAWMAIGGQGPKCATHDAQMCTRPPSAAQTLPVAVHALLKPISWLVGTWRGKGLGEYPTIPMFQYSEEVSFVSRGLPFLEYTQRTRELKPDGSLGTPLHTETGYLRMHPKAGLEFVVCDPAGQAQVQTCEVTLSGSTHSLVATSTHCARTPGGKVVDAVIRRYAYDEASAASGLVCSVDMAAVGVPMTRHLTSTLVRVLPLAVEAADAVTAIDGACVVDIREPDELVHGSALNPGSFAVPNVFHIPMGELIERAARPSDVVMDKLKAASLVFLVCNTGVRAVSAAELVRVSGITTAQAVEGGITAWNAAIASCSSRA